MGCRYSVSSCSMQQCFQQYQLSTNTNLLATNVRHFKTALVLLLCGIIFTVVMDSLTLSQWSSSGNPVAMQCAWKLDPSAWREHPSYCRTTVGIRPLGFLSAVGFCKPHPTTSPHHLPSLFAQHWAYSTSNTLIYSFDVRWLGTALSPTSYILQFCRIWIFIYIIIFSGKFYMKSKLQRCLYINFYQN